MTASGACQLADAGKPAQPACGRPQGCALDAETIREITTSCVHLDRSLHCASARKHPRALHVRALGAFASPALAPTRVVRRDSDASARLPTELACNTQAPASGNLAERGTRWMCRRHGAEPRDLICRRRCRSGSASSFHAWPLRTTRVCVSSAGPRTTRTLCAPYPCARACGASAVDAACERLHE